MSEASDNPDSNPFTSFPPEALQYLKRAFGILAGVPESAWSQLIDSASDSDRLLPSARERENWKVSEKDIRPLMVVVRLVVSAAADGAETAEHLFNSGIESGVIEDDSKDVLERFISTTFKNREKITD
ncbi:MAG: hypothetical protein WD034_12680, partial [Parvibaculum sp.]